MATFGVGTPVAAGGVVAKGTVGTITITKAATTATKVDAVIAETAAKVGSKNISSSMSLSGTELLDAGSKFLGSGAKGVAPGVYQKAIEGGFKQFRIDRGSIQGLHSAGKALGNVSHGHLEIWAKGASKPLVNNHIPIRGQ